MEIIQFIPQDLLILVVAAYALGFGFKKSSLLDKYIPILLLPFTVLFAILLTEAATRQSFAQAILQGILCWGVAIGVDQSIKQLRKEV